MLLLPLAGCVASAPQQDEPTASSQAATTVCGQTTVKGVDISHYDGTIDWTTAHQSGVGFAFALAEDGTAADAAFARNWAAMKSASVVRGAYQAFHADEDPDAQAMALVMPPDELMVIPLFTVAMPLHLCVLSVVPLKFS